MVCCATWYYLYNLKNVKNTHGKVLLLVRLQTVTFLYPLKTSENLYPTVCNFTKINLPPWVFFTCFKLYKWYQIAQSITFSSSKLAQCFYPPYFKYRVVFQEQLEDYSGEDDIIDMMESSLYLSL